MVFIFHIPNVDVNLGERTVVARAGSRRIAQVCGVVEQFMNVSVIDFGRLALQLHLRQSVALHDLEGQNWTTPKLC